MMQGSREEALHGRGRTFLRSISRTAPRFHLDLFFWVAAHPCSLPGWQERSLRQRVLGVMSADDLAIAS